MTSILNTELAAYRAANQSDLSTNGGRMSTSALSSGSVGQVFPNVDDAERAAGSTKYRKVFFKVDHAGTETLLAARLYQDQNTVGDDKICFHIGTQIDTRTDVTGSERKYGCGQLQTGVASGVTTLNVVLEPGQENIFVVGDVIRVTDKPTIADSGNEEFVTITAKSRAGDIATVVFTPALSNAYTSVATRVASVYVVGDLKPTNSVPTVTSAAGTLDTTTYPLTLNDKGTVEDQWTLTFASATAFNTAGAISGAVGAGSVSGGASPSNTAMSVPYFTLSASAFGGTYLAGDVILFFTHPAAVPVWMKRVVPAGAAVTATSTAVIVIDGGSL